MSGLSAKTILEGNRIFTEFKGSLAKQYVCQQLIDGCGFAPYYWSASNSSGEIDFIIQHEDEIVPIEVKAEENLKSKSLQAFCEKYPGLSPVRISMSRFMSRFRRQDWLTNIPLYAVSALKDIELA